MDAHSYRHHKRAGTQPVANDKSSHTDIQRLPTDIAHLQTNATGAQSDTPRSHTNTPRLHANTSHSQTNTPQDAGACDQRFIIAHRGLNRLAPENTLAAMKKMPDYGVTWLETDVDITSDGTLIIIHDETLDRTTNATGFYDDLSFHELKALDAGNWFSPEFAGEALPTLSEIIDLVNEYDLNINVEIKSNRQGKDRTYQLIDAVVGEVARLESGRQLIISSFNHLLLAELKRRAPHISVAALFTKETLGNDWLSLVELIGADYIHPENDGLTRERVQEIREAGYGVNVWTVNDRSRAEELFDWGVTGIFTDCADKLIDLSCS